MAINNTVQSPSVPSLLDFENFSTATACKISFEKHNSYILKLRSIQLSAEVLIDDIKPILEKILETDKEFIVPTPVNINIDLNITKIASPKVKSLPNCLASVVTGDDISSTDKMSDILDPSNKNLSNLNTLTDKATQQINDELENYTSNTDLMLDDANLLIEKAMNNLVDYNYIDLFRKLDNLFDFLYKTKYIQKYKNIKDLTICIKENCKMVSDDMMKDDFLWYDSNKTQFIMPIDINNSKIRINKFFDSLTREQEQICNNIEKRYYYYIDNKKEIINKASKILSDKGISEKNNPFIVISSSITLDRSDIVNNLF